MGKTILIVEDNQEILDALDSALQSFGFATRKATNGQEALDRLADTSDVGLVILDLMMPVMNGWEFRVRQQAHPNYSKIPIVVISADSNVLEDAGILGASGVLKKPLDLGDLKSVADRFCR